MVTDSAARAPRGTRPESREAAELRAIRSQQPQLASAVDLHLDPGALDSYSGRFTLMPKPSLVLQVSAGHLNDAELPHTGLNRIDVNRVTASAIFHRAVRRDGFWASTVAWGVNSEPTYTTHELLLESTVALNAADTLFGRFEVVGKPAHDLHVDESTSVFTLGKLQLGYVRYLAPRFGAQLGFGGSVSGSMVPVALEPRYGARVNPGFAVFMSVRPGAHRM